MANIYHIDTSSLIDLQENYPQNSFPTVWDRFESLITSSQLIAPVEVQNEIFPSNTFLHRWCRTNSNIFIPNNNQILTFVSEIMASFRQLVDPNKPGPVADPFLIALARSSISNVTNSLPIIVTQEGNKPFKIPNVANHYGIRSINLLELFGEENWTF